ncbi:MAG: WD40/YVTN/BNR-like repeat-containing protein, partial [Myxococcota bacterium]
MSHPQRFLRWSITAFALIGVGAFLFAQPANALGRREKPPEIVHGHRASEKPYGRPYAAGAWRILETKIDDDLRAVWATDLNHAWAAGVSGGLYRTTDAGETWTPLVGFDFARFAQILWKSPARGFALTKGGKVLRTDSGGDRWKTLRFGPGQRVRHMGFADANGGWAVGEQGLILYTADGGNTWARQIAEGAGELTHIQVLSANTAWAGGPGTLFRTRDGGAHWTPVAWHAAWHFVSGRRGYATDGDAIYRTTDGGESWQRLRSAAGIVRRGKTDAAGGSRGSADAPFIMSVRFVDRYNGLAEIIQGGLQRLFRTRSLGRVWKPVHDAAEGEAGELVHFSMSDGKTGLAIDARGNLRATGDGARTWPVQIPSDDFDLTAVRFADRRTGWAAGKTARILVTEDGGARWREVKRRFGGALLDIAAATLPAGGARAWAAGEGGRIAVSNPEGRAWQSLWRVQATPTRDAVRAVAFLDARRGAAVGEGGLVLLTEDGGGGWRRARTGAAETLRAVVYRDRELLVLAGGRTLLVSRDG